MRLLERLVRTRPILLALLVVVVSGAAVCGLLRLEYDDVPTNLFRSDDEAFRTLETVARSFATDENDCIAVVEADDLFTASAIDGLRRLVEGYGSVDGVDEVISMIDVPVFGALGVPRSLVPAAEASERELTAARAAALGSPLVAGTLLSADATTTIVIVRLAGQDLRTAHIGAVLARLREIDARIAEAAGLRVRFTGIPPIRVSVFSALERDQEVLTIAGSAVSGLIALLLFRRFAAVLIVGAPPLIGLLWALGSLGLIGMRLDVISGVLPTLVLVIGFTDAVHLVLHIRHDMARGMPRRDAAAAAVRDLGFACGLTSFTTAVGFGSLVVADIPSIQNFGIAAAVGAVATYLSVITLVPLLAATPLGDRIVVTRGAVAEEGWRRLWERLARPIVRYPRLVALAGVLVTVGLGLLTTRLQPDSRLTESLPTRYESHEALRTVDDKLGGILELQVLVEWDAAAPPSAVETVDALRRVAGRLDRHALVHNALSIASVTDALPAVLRVPALLDRTLDGLPEDVRRRFLRRDLGQALVTARLKDRYTSEHDPVLREVEDDLRALEGDLQGFRLRLTGTAVVVSRQITGMIRDLCRSLLTAAAIIFVVLTVCFRSVRLGLVSLIPNVFPMVAAASCLVLLDWPLLLSGSIVFTVCLGIAVDDTIHFITRYRREIADGVGPRTAVERSFRAIGRALVVTTLVFVCGFCCVHLSEIPVLRFFGVLASIAIAAALVGDLVILPALLLCLGHRRDASS